MHKAAPNSEIMGAVEFRYKSTRVLAELAAAIAEPVCNVAFPLVRDICEPAKKDQKSSNKTRQEEPGRSAFNPGLSSGHKTLG